MGDMVTSACDIPCRRRLLAGAVGTGQVRPPHADDRREAALRVSRLAQGAT